MPRHETDHHSIGEADGFARQGVMLFGFLGAVLIGTIICVIVG
jgi:hypothetical protein